MFIYFIKVYLHAPGCVYVLHVHLGAYGGQKRELDHVDLDLQIAVGTGTEHEFTESRVVTVKPSTTL